MIYEQCTIERTQTLRELWWSKSGHTCCGSNETGGIRVFQLQTDAIWAWGSGLMRPGLIVVVPNACNLESPWMKLPSTVENQSFFLLKLPKQSKIMMIQSQSKKNFQIWLKDEEDWCIWSSCALDENLRIGMVVRSNLGVCEFCYD